MSFTLELYDDKPFEERRENPVNNWGSYARDRARIIHSASFRRLQGKTQVLGVGENDFYRTRLTHSLEVAQIGSGIVEALKKKYKEKSNVVAYIPPSFLIEAIGLAHDIGHPPFGHKGEQALDKKMRGHGGFEANGQTLRICTKLGEETNEYGLNLTRRCLLGLLKYPQTYSNLVFEESEKPPKSILDTEIKDLEWILSVFHDKDRQNFISFDEIDKANKKTKYKSFDCSIMELADDIAYAVHDLEDAISLDIITRDDWQSAMEGIEDTSYYNKIGDGLFSSDHCRRKRSISNLVNRFIVDVSVRYQNDFSHALLALQAFVSDGKYKEITALKKLTYNNVVSKYEVKTLEYRGGVIVNELYSAIFDDIENLLPENYKKRLKEKGSMKARIVCDYIAGMTDRYASMLHNRLFTANPSSVFTKL